MAYKRGNKVFVCYDGKLCRGNVGTVIETRRGHHIKVRFVPFCSEDEKEVEVWFRVKPKNRFRYKYYEGYHVADDSLMSRMFGLPGDYYTCRKITKEISTHYLDLSEGDRPSENACKVLKQITGAESPNVL